MDTAKKKAELEKRLQDVSGQLSGTKSKSKKNAGKYNFIINIPYLLSMDGINMIHCCCCWLIYGIYYLLGGEGQVSRLSESSSSDNSSDGESSSSGSGSSTSSSDSGKGSNKKYFTL